MNNPNKIVHIITGLEVGGAEQMLKRLLFSDPESKNNTLIISLTGMGAVGEHLQESGYKIHTLDFRSLSSILPNFWALIRLLKAKKPLMVQTWMYHADFFGGIAARLAGCRNVIWGIRNTGVPKNNRKTHYLMRLCALLSHVVPKKIVCVAAAAKKKHISYGYSAKKMVVIPNGFDFSCFDPERVNKATIRSELGLSPTDFVVGCVGRSHLDKGQDIFITAIAYLEKIHDRRVLFMLVGRGCDHHNAELMRQIDSFGLTSEFILLGERHDIPECLAAMDVYCMPSRTEGFPNGLGEAMSMGLPCVATHVGDTKVLTGDTAVLVAADDPMALAAGLTKILRMPVEQRKLLGQEAAIQVRKQFSIDNTRKRFYELYRELTESSH